MALYALDDLDDAIDVTERFLLPFDLRRWAALALVTFFVGVPGGTTFQFNTGAGGGAPSGSTDWVPPQFGNEIVPTPRLYVLVGAIVVAAIAVGLFFLLVGSIMEFVLVESLRTEEVRVRRYWSRRWRQGLRLFGFRIVLGLLLFGPFAAVFVLTVLPFLLGTAPTVPLVGIFLFLPVFFLLALLVGLISGFTTAFVVPIMIVEDCGVLAGWRQLWPTVRDRWKQYGAYAVMAFVLAIAAGILIGIAMAAVAVALLIPFGLLGALGWLLLSSSTIAGYAIIAIAGALFLLALLTAFAFVSVPVVAYLRYYALLVLGDTNGAFDLIPDQRAAVRSDVAR